MKKAVVAVLAFLGFLLLLAVLVCGSVGLFVVGTKERLPSSIVLDVDFERGVVETVPDDPIARILGEGTPQLSDVVDALDRAADDRRVKGLVARIGSGGMGMAHIQEIRDAVTRFRASGKPAVAFGETFGEVGPGNGGYYLASAFDEIYLQPSGDIGLTGLVYESPFIRGTLEKLGVTPRMGQRYEYKNAMNLFTERAYTPAHREAMQVLMESQFGQIVRAIAEARDMTEQQVRELFDRGPFLGAEAKEAGLVDALMYRDEVRESIRGKVEGDPEFVPFSRYIARGGSSNRKGTTIALIHGYGAVVRGKSAYSALEGSSSMGADTVAAAFRDAVEDDRVKAIVFRVDSPGGSYVASDTIWRETLRARDANKPVIVSMGNVAGSGGYFVAMDAEKIVAQPGTITASIGVLGGKMLTREFWDKLGISWDEVHTSANSTLFYGTHDYSEAGWNRFNSWLDRVYEDFTHKVAEGRHLPLEKVQEVAKGRIWSGEDAKRLGLVDELGGMDVALRLAREAAGLAPDAPVKLKVFPRPRTPVELLFDREGESSSDVALGALARLLGPLQPKIRVLHQIMETDRDLSLSVPPMLPEP